MTGRRLTLAIILLAAATVCGLMAALRITGRLAFSVQPGGRGRTGEWIDVPGDQTRRLVFTDGSRIEAHGPGSLKVAETSRRGAQIVATSGELSLTVAARADARWSVRCTAGDEVSLSGGEQRHITCPPAPIRP